MIGAALRPAALTGACFAVAAVAVAIVTVALTLPMPPASAAVAFALFALVAWHVLAALPGGHPHARFGVANSVTLFRAGGAAVFAGLAASPGLVGDAAGWAAAGAAALLLALDGVDGWVAQRQGLASAFGARFDLEVDALTILALAALAWALGKAGLWVLALGLMRYAFLAGGQLWPSLAAPLPASARRKAICVLQVGVLAALLAPPLGPPVSGALAALALGALVWSFGLDVVALLRLRS